MTSPSAHGLRPLALGDWLVGLVVLTIGVLLPLGFVYKKLFGASRTTKRSA